MHWMTNKTKPVVQEVFIKALKDDFWGIRFESIKTIDLEKGGNYNASTIKLIETMALSDSKSKNRQYALKTMDEFHPEQAIIIADTLFHQDSSRLVRSEALAVLYYHDKDKDLELAEMVELERNFWLNNTVAAIYAEKGDKNKHDFFKRIIWTTRTDYLSPMLASYSKFLERMDTQTLSEAGVFLTDLIKYEESDHFKTQCKKHYLRSK